jgi:DHA2 family multidrug resistance protein
MMGYPVLTAGLVLGPRGIGTMIAMVFVGRLVRFVDPRYLIGFGVILTAVALWEMSGISVDVSQFWVIRTGFVQGFGLGFIFVPMQTVAFDTLPMRLRTDGAALLALTRNIGSSIGISIVMFMLTRNISVMHDNLAKFTSPFRPAISALHGTMFSPSTGLGQAVFEQLVSQQAAMVAYADDFWMMFWVTLAMLPLLLLMKRPATSRQRRGGGAPAHAAME